MDFRSELVRKTIHLCSALAPLIYALTNREFCLAVGVPILLLFALIDLLRLKHAGFRALFDRHLGRVMRSHEQTRLCGATYVMLAIVLCILLYPKRVALAALLFLAVSDSLASLVGVRAGGPRWFGKTLAGSATFLVSALAIALLCFSGRWLLAVLGAVVATLVEAIPLRLGRLRLDDNLVVPVVSGAVMTLLYGRL